MLFQQVIDHDTQHMARVCGLDQERVRSIKAVPFLIVASVSLSSGETVPTKWQPCQDKIITTTEANVENQEKTSQNKLKLLQLTNGNTNKIAGSNFLKPMQRHRKFMESKGEECHETNAIVQVLKIGRGDEKDVIKDWSSGIQAEFGKYEKVVEELEELELKRIRVKRNSEERGDHHLPKLVITTYSRGRI